jgi:hypothetical protein
MCSIWKTVCLGSSYPATLHIFSVFRLVWCVCVRPSLYPPQWFPDITWERISNFVPLLGNWKGKKELLNVIENWKKMVQIVGNLEWELLKNVEIRKSKYARILLRSLPRTRKITYFIYLFSVRIFPFRKIIDITINYFFYSYMW